VLIGYGGTAYVDIIGVGGGVYDRLREMGHGNVYEFNSSAQPYDTERFGNRRAEAYWHVRELAERSELDLPPEGEDDDLIAQLGAIQWKMRNGRIYIETKEEMEARLGSGVSPDRADALFMSLARGQGITAFEFTPNVEEEKTSGLRTRPM
jgi:hypothetical protein